MAELSSKAVSRLLKEIKELQREAIDGVKACERYLEAAHCVLPLGGS